MATSIKVLILFISSSFVVLNGEAGPANSSSTLELVQVVFRHGDRNPEYTFPKDVYQNESLWPGGWGQITPLGRAQAFSFGKYLRNRYGDFLSQSYETGQVFTLSSDLDRTIISAQMALLGLFPPSSKEMSKVPGSHDPTTDLGSWSIAPVRTVAKKDDNIIRMSGSCPNYYKLHQEFLKTNQKMRDINEANYKEYQKLTNLTGVEIANINDFYKFYATLEIEKAHNLTLPLWAEHLFVDEHFQELYSLSMATMTMTKAMKTIRGGPLAKLVLTNISNKMNKICPEEMSKRKLVLISGHDTTIAQLLDVLGVFKPHVPPYMSSVIVELRRNNDDGHYFVNVLYRNVMDQNEPLKMIVPSCDFDCPVDTLSKWLDQYFPVDWDALCTIPPEHTSRMSSAGLFAIIGLIVWALCCGAVYMFIKFNRRKTSNYTRGAIIL